ncbi:MAG: glycine zipper domain-containing protein [Xanthomonadales bacterium]|nr:glycine zipper domain-containing protein [Xanthomonadales bacterium]
MKTITVIVFGLLLSLPATFTQAQSTGQQSLAGTLGIYVFPAQGQNATQQSEDEAACYQWAVSNTGSDPFAVQKQQQADAQQAQAAQQQAAQAGQGSAARGAVGGAAVGALVGEIADDDAGKGAAYGAALGAIRGRRKGRQQQEAAQQQAQAQAEQAQQVTQGQMDAFKKAFSACMEGKNYIAKF